MESVVKFTARVSVVVLVLVYGVFIGLKLAPPTSISNHLHLLYVATADFARHWRHDLGLEPTRLLVPNRFGDAQAGTPQ